MVFHIIVNAARMGEKLIDRVLKAFARHGAECVVHRTDHKGHAAETAAELTEGGAPCAVVVMGGDGTLHEVLNGIKHFENCSMGLIPCGTGNDFAVAAGIPKNIEEAVKIIACGTPAKIDYIQLADGLKSLNAVGMGIDVDVLKKAYSGGSAGKGKYLTSLIYCLKHFESYNFTVEYEGKREKHYGLIAALGNGRQIGGGIKLFPEARLDDGYMDLLIVDYISKFKMITAFIKLMLGKINAIKEVTALRVKSAAFYPEKPCAIQAEGEIYEGRTLDAHIVEGGLNFYLPERAKAAKSDR